MRVSSLALLACCATLLPACGGYEPGEHAVAVSVYVAEYDVSHGLYAEGSYSYVRVERLDGEELLEERLEQEGARLRLDPGAYRFASFQRPCDGNCESLDPPEAECERVIRVERAMEVRVFATAGLPCRLVPR
jgi:hypothetical protein